MKIFLAKMDSIKQLKTLVKILKLDVIIHCLGGVLGLMTSRQLGKFEKSFRGN